MVLLRPLLCVIVACCTGSLYAQQGHMWTWKGTPDSVKLKKCISEMKLLLNASPIPLAGIEGHGKPNAMDTVIAFNRNMETGEGSAPFVFPGSNGVNTCKSVGMDHDAVVTACLLVVQDHFNNDEVTVSSDKKIDTEWKDGAAFYTRVLGREPKFKRSSGVAGLTDIVSKINLKPSWDWSRLWIVFALLAVGGGVAWFLFNPRPDFTIYFERQGNAYVKGSFPEVYANAVRAFFKADLPMKRNALVRGWNEPDGRFRLNFVGPISDREQQQIRNFFAMLRKK